MDNVENNRDIITFTDQSVYMTLEITQDEYHVTCDVVDLNPSIPIQRAIEVITGTIASDWKPISKRTMLSLLDVTVMIEASLQK